MFVTKYLFPDLSCVNEILPKVKTPSIYDFQVQEERGSNNYPADYRNGTLVVLSDGLYNLIKTNDNDYTLQAIDLVGTNFGAPISIVTPNFDHIIIPDSDNNKIYFWMGKKKSDTAAFVNDVYVYDHATKATTLVGAGGTKRAFGAGCCYDNKLYVYGGQVSGYIANFECYDLATNQVTAMASTPVARVGGSIIGRNGSIYLTGATYIDQGTEAKKIWKWVIGGTTWEHVGTTPDSLAFEARWVVHNNALYLYNTSSMEALIALSLYQFDDGVGAGYVFGPEKSSPVFSHEPVTAGIGRFTSAASYNSSLYFAADIAEEGNNRPCNQCFGYLDITGNKVVATKWEWLKFIFEIQASPLITDITDLPFKVRFEYKTDASSEGLIVEYELETLAPEMFSDRWFFIIDQPDAIPYDLIQFVRIGYKSDKSNWSAWSASKQRA